MDKILILDDGTNVKAYSESEKMYVKVGDYPPTLDMFEQFGNEQIFERKGLAFENPTVLMYSKEKKSVKIVSKVMPKYKTIILKKSENIAGEGIKNIEINYTTSETSDVKLAFSNNDKQSYHTFNFEKNIWEEVDITTEKVFLEKGLSCNEVNKMTSDEFNLIFTKDKTISFAIIMKKSNAEDVCNIKSIKINYLI